MLALGEVGARLRVGLTPPSHSRHERSRMIAERSATPGQQERAKRRWAVDKTFEADGETRTPDPIITSDVLYQLSYVGGCARRRFWTS
jgi:hypothetical protein